MSLCSTIPKTLADYKPPSSPWLQLRLLNLHYIANSKPNDDYPLTHQPSWKSTLSKKETENPTTISLYLEAWLDLVPVFPYSSATQVLYPLNENTSLDQTTQRSDNLCSFPIASGLEFVHDV